MNFKVTVMITLAVLVLIVFTQNNQIVTYHFLFWKVSLSQLVLLPLTTFAGFVIGFLVGKLTGKK
jgi:uncharacterized integral membrane protein